TILRTFRIALLLAASIAAGSSFAQGQPVVFGEPAKAESARIEPILRIAPKVAGRRLLLAPVTDVEIGKLRAENERTRASGGTHVNLKRIAIGIERELEAAAVPLAGALDWAPVAGGRA